MFSFTSSLSEIHLDPKVGVEHESVKGENEHSKHYDEKDQIQTNKQRATPSKTLQFLNRIKSGMSKVEITNDNAKTDGKSTKDQNYDNSDLGTCETNQDSVNDKDRLTEEENIQIVKLKTTPSKTLQFLNKLKSGMVTVDEHDDDKLDVGPCETNQDTVNDKDRLTEEENIQKVRPRPTPSKTLQFLNRIKSGMSKVEITNDNAKIDGKSSKHHDDDDSDLGTCETNQDSVNDKDRLTEEENIQIVKLKPTPSKTLQLFDKIKSGMAKVEIANEKPKIGTFNKEVKHSKDQIIDNPDLGTCDHVQENDTNNKISGEQNSSTSAVSDNSALAINTVHSVSQLSDLKEVNDDVDDTKTNSEMPEKVTPENKRNKTKSATRRYFFS